MLISVIVPVYNVEAYLEKCVNSILHQTYENIEVILIDDGSTDNSGAICDALAADDLRIKVLHKSNGGVSSARNLGISVASGAYICFVDSDDWLDIDYFELVAPILIKQKPILLQNNYVKDDGEGNTTCKFLPSEDFNCTAKQAFYEMATGCHYGWEPFASFYEATACKKVKFDTHIVYGEDLLFRFQFCQLNEGRYIYHYMPKYHYFIRENSAVNSYSIYKKVDDLKVFEQIMPQVDKSTKKILLEESYIPRLVGYYRLGINSNEPKDIAAAKIIRNKIKKNILVYCKDNNLSAVLKIKLMASLLPKRVLSFIYCLYKLMKKAAH